MLQWVLTSVSLHICVLRQVTVWLWANSSWLLTGIKSQLLYVIQKTHKYYRKRKNIRTKATRSPRIGERVAQFSG